MNSSVCGLCGVDQCRFSAFDREGDRIQLIFSIIARHRVRFVSKIKKSIKQVLVLVNLDYFYGNTLGDVFSIFFFFFPSPFENTEIKLGNLSPFTRSASWQEKLQVNLTGRFLGKKKIQDSNNALVNDLFLGFGLLCQTSSLFLICT